MIFRLLVALSVVILFVEVEGGKKKCPEQKSRVRKLTNVLNNLLAGSFNNKNKLRKLFTDDAQVMIHGSLTAIGKEDSIEATKNYLDSLRAQNVSSISISMDEAKQVSLERSYGWGTINHGIAAFKTRMMGIWKSHNGRKWRLQIMAINIAPSMPMGS